jgi:predicted RNA-binding Zn-ribbon protein involved in translation (DUF1610 family)
MKQISQEQAVADALNHSRGNRKEIEASKRAECFSCGHAFAAKDVSEWRDEWTSPEKQNRVPRWSAICPQCGKPTVIGDASGLLLMQDYGVILKHIIQKQIGAARQ